MNGNFFYKKPKMLKRIPKMGFSTLIEKFFSLH